MAENPIDLGDLIKDPKYINATIESAEDAAARRQEKSELARHKRSVHLIILIFALVLVFLIFLGCIYEYQVGSADDKKWAGAVIVSFGTGLLGYIVGQRLD